MAGGLKRRLHLHSFAPLDIPHANTKKQFVRLFRAVGVPTSFICERLQSVSHSFGDVSGPSGSCKWFHFLCKRIDLGLVNPSRVQAPEVLHHEGASYDPRGGARERALPQADYAYDRSGYFLHTNSTGAVTLCCFGASGPVRSRLERFLASGDWKQAFSEPFILLDLVLEGLHLQVDENVWNMNVVFGAAEHVSFRPPPPILVPSARALANRGDSVCCGLPLQPKISHCFESALSRSYTTWPNTSPTCAKQPSHVCFLSMKSSLG